MLADYGWGGYVIHELYQSGGRVFVDGRNDMYDQQVLEDYDAIKNADPGWEALADRYGVEALLLDAGGDGDARSGDGRRLVRALPRRQRGALPARLPVGADRPQSTAMPHTVILVALSALVLAPGLLSGPSLDAAVFMQVAERMRAGDVLYAGIWDHKPPGIYLVLVAGQSLLPFLSAWAVSWILSVAATAATGWAVLTICRGLGTTRGASLVAGAICVVVMGEFLLSLGGGLTEPVAALPLAFALLATLAAFPAVGPRRALGVGALLGVSLLLSVQAAAGIAAVGALVWMRGGRPVVAVAGAVAGIAIVLVAAGAWLGLSGALPAAIDAVVTYNGAYRAVAAETGATLGGPVIAWTLLALLFVVVPVFYGARAGMRDVAVTRQATLACLVWMALALVSFVVQGRFLAHYAIPLAIPLGVLSGMGIDAWSERVRAGRSALIAPILLTLAISSVAAVAAGAMEFGPIQRDRARAQAVDRGHRSVVDLGGQHLGVGQ